MPEQGMQNGLSHRDGSSQSSRQRDALSPNYVAVDERSLRDLLAFVRDYARELRYFDADNQSRGTWSEFLSEDIDLDDVVALCEAPDTLSADKAERFRRPHFSLLLAFVKLLSESQAHLNSFTERHLNFYFQQVLSLQKRSAEPDRVHVFFELAKNRQPVWLKRGTQLNAGKDTDGRLRAYALESDLIVTAGRIAQCRSVFVDSEMIGIAESRRRYLQTHGDSEPTRREAFLEMLRIALGRPGPGDELPLYADGQALDYSKLLSLQTLVSFITKKTGLALQFSTFNELIKLKQQRDLAELDGEANGEWLRINRILRQAQVKRTGDADTVFDPDNPRDFDSNLKQAIGLSTDQELDFSGLPQVETLTDLYRQLLQEGREDDVVYPIQDFIDRKLYLQPFIAADQTPEVSLSFEAMMQVKVRIDAHWTRINKLLEQAYSRKHDNQPLRITPPHSPDFDNNLQQAIAPDFSEFDGVDSLDSFYSAIVDLEQYFFLPAADIAYLLNLLDEVPTEDAAARWKTAQEILATAHKNLALYEKEQALVALQNAADPLLAMLQKLMPASPASEDVVSLLGEIGFFASAAEFAYLSSIAAGDTATPDWNRVARTLAIVQRNLEGGDPVPAKEQWYNLYPAEDAKQVRAATVDSGDSTPSWLAFGAAQKTVAPHSESPREIGWAICSPLFFLEQGQREITLTLYFSAEGYDQAAIEDLLAAAGGEQSLLPLRCGISGQDTWLKPDALSIEQVVVEEKVRTETGERNDSLNEVQAKPERALRITLVYNPEAPPLVASGSDLGIEKATPVLRVLLRQQWQSDTDSGDTGRYISHYHVFRDLQLTRIHCEVAVDGLTNLHLQNDSRVLDARSPFEPFGLQPVAGSSLLLGHRELLYKQLDAISFKIKWMGLSSDFDFQAHYNNYSRNPSDFSYDKFNTSIALWERASGKSLITSSNRQLFEKAGIGTRTIQLKELKPYSAAFPLSLTGDVKQWDRYFIWELGTPDFQHHYYPALANQKAIELAAKLDAGTAKPADYIVNPPYTPKIKQLSVDYSCSLEIDLRQGGTADLAEQLLHIHPFGYAPLPSRSYFLPRYTHQGELYIGLSDLQLPQNLSVLFQLAEGTADPDLEPQAVRWSYLSANQWLDMADGDIVRDSTGGLIQSGIIEFSLRPAQTSTLLPSNLYWLRATVEKNSRSVAAVVALHTQAAVGKFLDRGNAVDHYSQPLPAETIKRFMEPVAGIGKVYQPYTSFDGREPEQDALFHTRVSERLRHKQRCVNVWDYEQVVLDQFPQIFKARCMPAQLVHDGDIPGELTLTVIPDIRNRIPFESFAPKVSRALLADIQAWVDKCKPMSAVVRVNNPFYIQVKVRLSVRFHQGADENFFKHQLNQELKRFLSPWAYDEGADIIIGGRVYANNLINFVEQRPYIDYVADVKLFSSEDGGRNFVYKAPPAVDSSEGYFIDSSRSDGVLVAAQQHIIDIIPDSGYQEELFTGINFMKVELDFQVG